MLGLQAERAIETAGHALSEPGVTSALVEEMDLLARTVVRGGEEILLQPREFRLLEFLMKHSGQVVTRTMLLEHVWDYHFDPQTNVIDVHISRLRGKIDKGFDKPLLHTNTRLPLKTIGSECNIDPQSTMHSFLKQSVNFNR